MKGLEEIGIVFSVAVKRHLEQLLKKLLGVYLQQRKYIHTVSCTFQLQQLQVWITSHVMDIKSNGIVDGYSNNIDANSVPIYLSGRPQGL